MQQIVSSRMRGQLLILCTNLTFIGWRNCALIWYPHLYVVFNWVNWCWRWSTESSRRGSRQIRTTTVTSRQCIRHCYDTRFSPFAPFLTWVVQINPKHITWKRQYSDDCCWRCLFRSELCRRPRFCILEGMWSVAKQFWGRSKTRSARYV